MPINYAKLIQGFTSLIESEGLTRAEQVLRESFEAKELRPKDFDFGKLFASCFGFAAFQECRTDKTTLATRIMEAAGAVNTAAFQGISGQIVFNAIQEAYASEEFVFTKLIPESQTSYSGEIVPLITDIGDEALVVGEEEPFPLAGVGSDWVISPPTTKKGLIVPVTREAVFFDRTNQVLERCSKVGEALGLGIEKRAIDCLIDENRTEHRYNWRDFGKLATYGDNSGNHTWDNLAASNALVDWTDLDIAEQLFNGLTDPFTGEPIVIDPKHLIVTKQLEPTAHRVLNAMELHVATPGYATSGNPTLTKLDNPYRGKYQLVSSRLLAARLATDTDWFLGDISKACVRMVNWPLQTKQAPPNSHEEFHRDIVQQYRADERSVFFVKQPRALVKSTA